ncbi:MAG: thiamine pyrophosphate-binding protein [Desulfobacterales bacterium]|nr:thiamine pyrophosphate-binding protein [Desulfobacterales bacterium]
MGRNDLKAQYGSDVMADALGMLDIKYAAINPGSTYRGLHDSIVNYRGNKPEIITCNHEGIAVSIAHGYGKVAGKPMAAIVHNVVGLLHGTNAIYNAWLDEAPMLVLGATGPMDIEKRRPWIDWIHTAMIQGNVVRDYVKWDDQPFTVGAVPDSFIRGYQIATTAPQGPVYICLDNGLQEETLTREIPLPSMDNYPAPFAPQGDPCAIDQAAKRLVEATNPVVIADYMGKNPKAVPALVELAELLALPVVDGGARFNFPSTHPLDLTGADRSLFQDADVVLLLDVNNPSRFNIPEKTCVIHITAQHLPGKSWSQSFGKLIKVDLPITADTALALPALTEACRKVLTNARRQELQLRFEAARAKHEALRKKWQTEADKAQEKSPIHMSYLTRQVWELIKKEDWALVSKGERGWARRLWDFDKTSQYAGSYGLGCGMGHALGAALAHRPAGRLCINFQPDGDLLFTPAALWTAAHHNIPLLIIMNNNRTYYNSERHQEVTAKSRNRSTENRGIGTRMENPNVNFAGLARDFGLFGVGPIEKPGDLRPALEEAIRVVKDKKQAALVDVVTFPHR